MLKRLTGFAYWCQDKNRHNLVFACSWIFLLLLCFLFLVLLPAYFFPEISSFQRKCIFFNAKNQFQEKLTVAFKNIIFSIEENHEQSFLPFTSDQCLRWNVYFQMKKGLKCGSKVFGKPQKNLRNWHFRLWIFNNSWNS